jgi:hypothetical protein
VPDAVYVDIGDCVVLDGSGEVDGTGDVFVWLCPPNKDDKNSPATAAQWPMFCNISMVVIIYTYPCFFKFSGRDSHVYPLIV